MFLAAKIHYEILYLEGKMSDAHCTPTSFPLNVKLN